VAFSFTENYRDYIRQVYKELLNWIKPENLFFDERFKPEIAGFDADLILQKFYHEDSELIVIFLCKEYKEREWCCNVEWRAIRNLIKTGQSQRILPLRFDDTDIPGIYSTDICPNINEWEPHQVAELIWKRLKLFRGETDEKNSSISKPEARTSEQSIQMHLRQMREFEVIPPHKAASSGSTPIVENDFQRIYFRAIAESVTARGEKVKFKDVVRLLTEKFARVLVFGESGVGKTTLARAICRCFVTNDRAHIVPIYLPVRMWRETLNDLSNAQDKALRHIIPSLGCELADIPDIFNATGRKLVLVVDGLNECTDAEKTIMSRSALDIIRKTTDASLLMTSRRVAFSRDEFEREDLGFRMYELCPWTYGQLTKYWSKNGLDPATLKQFPAEVLTAMRLPLFAWMAAQEYLYGRNTVRSPITLTDLFQHFIDRAIRNFTEQAKLELRSDIGFVEVRLALQRLAFQMTINSLLEIAGSNIHEYAGRLRIDWKHMLYTLIKNDLLQLAQEPVFVANMQDEDVSKLKIMFFHQAIQEMLTAEYIVVSYDPVAFFHDSKFRGEKLILGNISEQAFWREIPLYMMSLLATTKSQHTRKARDFVEGFITHKDYLTGARTAAMLPTPEKNELRSIIASKLIDEMANQDSYAQSKETFWELGEEGRKILLKEIRPSIDLAQIIPRPEFHLHKPEIVKKLKERFKNNDEDIERLWRRFGRTVTIIG
jgi:energy-coupling factor transporter ATP-binding protein EcfA2